MKKQNETTLAKRSTTPATAPVRRARAASAPAATTLLEAIKLPPGHRDAPELRHVRFGYFQADAREVFLVGSFNGWNPRATPMQRDALGDWSVELNLPPGEYRYRLIVDGQWKDDPSAQQTAMNPYGGFDAVIVL